MIITSIKIRHSLIEVDLHNSWALQCQFPYLQANLNGKHGEKTGASGLACASFQQASGQRLAFVCSSLHFLQSLTRSDHRIIPLNLGWKSSFLASQDWTCQMLDSFDGWQIAGIPFWHSSENPILRENLSNSDDILPRSRNKWLDFAVDIVEAQTEILKFRNGRRLGEKWLPHYFLDKDRGLSEPATNSGHPPWQHFKGLTIIFLTSRYFCHLFSFHLK